MTNITQNRFLDCIASCYSIIKKTEDVKITLKNYFAIKNRGLAMFFNFLYKGRKEYVKIYLNDDLRACPNLRIDVYLYQRGERCGINRSGQIEYRDLLIKSFTDFDLFKAFLSNLSEEIKKIEVK